MIIGMFSESYLPMINGVVTSIDTLRRGLEKLGHTVYVICTTAQIENVEDDPYVIRLKGFNIPIKQLNNFQLVEGAYKKFREQAPNIKFDIIHIHTEFSVGTVGIKTAVKENIPLIYTFHTMYEDYGHYVLPFGLRHIGYPFYMLYVKTKFKRIVKHVDCMILPTLKVLDMLNRYKVSKPNKIIPTGIDLSKFDDSNYKESDILELKKKYNLENYTTLLYIGRISKEKSIDELIMNYKKCKISSKAKLVIVGEGPCLDEIKQLVVKEKLENDVIFTGPVPNKLIGLYYRLGDIFVNASETETQGLTFIEAQASNLPILCKYDTNLDMIVYDNENGLFYHNDQEFKSKLLDLIENKEKRLELAKNSKKYLDKYSVDKFVNDVLDLYNEYVEKRSV